MTIRHQFRRHKYNVSPKADRTVDGITFDSKKEAKFYVKLRQLEEAGEVLFFLRQTPFHLPGGTRYVCDFAVVWSNGTLEFIDVKGVRTAAYKAKKKQVEALYGPRVDGEIITEI